MAMPIVPAGEDLCLDFANTRYWRGRAAPTETLSGFADLLDWLDGRAGLSSSIVAAARDWAQTRPREAEHLFAAAIDLREAIYEIFAAAAVGATIAEGDLARFNDALATAPPRARLVRAETGYGWVTAPAGISTALLLAPVSWSAADLLTRLERQHVRRCANDECLWLFVDHSKGGTRRWCDMSSCGNRAKSQRHYRRTRPAAKPQS